jgi:succinoglycan biosynthesis transport protein ExoP
LSELLSGTESIEDIPAGLLVRVTDVPKLFVLPRGRALDEAGDLLHSDRMTQLLRRCRQSFDNIIIDSSPISHMPDARVLGRLADGVVLLIRAGTTSRATAQAVLDRLAQDGTPFFGTILNQWTPNRHDVSSYYRFYDRASNE